MMEHEPDDAELARKARAGDAEALSALVERTRLHLFAVAYRELQQYEDAQDAVASALLKICLHIGEVREPERIRAWMNHIARNEARLIRRNARPVLALEDEEQSVPFEEGSAALRLDIRRALQQLPREQARSLTLYYLARLSIPEIARRLERPEGTIKRWLHLGRRFLAREMKEYAPMSPTLEALILHTDYDAQTVQSLSGTLREAGFRVSTLQDFPALEQSGTDETLEFHLPASVKECRFIVMDERVGKRSAFELHTLIRGTAEGKQVACCLLASAPAAEDTIRAAWMAGFDLCFIHPVQPAEFRGFAERIHANLSNPA